MIIADIPPTTIDGEQGKSNRYGDKVMLIVNVTSRCGLARQYAKLEELQEVYGDGGFTVLGFPSNQFLQEMSSSEAIFECGCGRAGTGWSGWCWSCRPGRHPPAQPR